jgi:MFS family permease
MLAATFSFMGTFIQDVAERWLVLELTGTPMPVAMVTTAFVTGSLVAMLPAGVLADRIDRRRVVVWSQIVQAAAATIIGLLTLTKHATPAVLIGGAATAGLGMGLGAPAWSALVNEILPREQVADGVAMHSIAFNLARAVGPAIGGVVLSLLGAPISFFLNAASFVFIIVAVVRHRPEERKGASAEHPPLSRAVVEPFSFVFRDLGVRSIFFSMWLFTSGAAFLYALAPALAKLTLKADANEYGLMIGAMGAGAVIGALSLKKLRARLPPRVLVAMMMALYAVSSLAVARAEDPTIAVVLFVPAGIGWTCVFTSLAALNQLSAPNHLRARVVALYTMSHFIVYGVAATIAGVIAEAKDIRTALVVGGIACFVAALVTIRLAGLQGHAPARENGSVGKHA